MILHDFTIFYYIFGLLISPVSQALNWGLGRVAPLKKNSFEASLQPCVARKSGTSLEDPEEETGKSIPKDTILPALMISLCCFNNTVARQLVVEWSGDKLETD